jgi:hypothetical protein
MALGQVRDLNHLRQIVARSSELTVHEPMDAGNWDQAAERFSQLTAAG